MGVITIKTMMAPIATIPSVEPISDSSTGWGVVVPNGTGGVAEGSPCIAGRDEYVNPALSNARLKQIVSVSAGRRSFLIISF